MLIASQNLTNYDVNLPDDVIFRINLAWINDLGSLRDILERRLQTVVYKMGLANSVKQARQFILHRKVVVNELSLIHI